MRDAQDTRDTVSQNSRLDLELLHAFQKRGDLSARNLLVERNMGLVRRIAQGYSRFMVPEDDLVQEGALGLMRALESYKPEKAQFSTYASLWIKSSIHTAIVRNWSLVKAGTTVLERKLFGRVGNLPDHTDRAAVEQLAREVQGSVEDVSAILLRVLRKRDISLSDPISHRSTRSCLEDLVASDSDQQETLEQAELEELLHRSLDTLTEQQRWIIEKRYLAANPLTLQECGDILGCSKQHVAQVQDKALHKLKRFLEWQGVRQSA